MSEGRRQHVESEDVGVAYLPPKLGISQVVKALDFDSSTREFKSLVPSQLKRKSFYGQNLQENVGLRLIVFMLLARMRRWTR